MDELTHLDEQGKARMVNVGDKPVKTCKSGDFDPSERVKIVWGQHCGYS